VDREHKHYILTYVTDMHVMPDKIIFPITSKIKQSRPSQHTSPLQFKFYPQQPKLCVVKHLIRYVELTENLRFETTKLFVSYIKPHKAVSKDTISRWCKVTLKNSGINTKLFSAHSSAADRIIKVESYGYTN